MAANQLDFQKVNLEDEIVDILKAKKLTITTAESCTGGMVSARLINVAGISMFLKEAYITYADETKQKILGVKAETLQKYTAVSEQTAREMAEGGAKVAKADLCVSVTGIAGPDGGSETFPVGLVYIGCFYKGTTIVKRYVFEGNRAIIRTTATDKALELVLQRIK